MKVELTNINRSLEVRFLSLLGLLASSIRKVLSFKLNSKMRILFTVLLFCLSSSAWSQPWQNALKDARKAYVTKSYEESVAHYQKAQKLAPKNIDLSIELAQSLYRAGKYEEAEKIYGSQVGKNHGKISSSDISRQLGDSRMQQQKFAEAIDAYKHALRSNPADEVARHNLTKAIRKQEEKSSQNQEQNQNPQQPKESDPNSKEENPKNDPPVENKSANNPLPEKKPEQSSSTLNDKRAERLLEELTQKEKETKRKMNSNVGDKTPSKPGTKKDW